MSITDFTANENDSQVLQWYKRLMAQIQEIDETLDATSETAGKRKFTNELVTAAEKSWKPVTDAHIAQMGDMTPEILAGTFYGLIRTLTNTFKENIDNWITAQVEAQPQTEVQDISDEQKKKLAEERSAFAKQVKTIVDMAITFNETDAANPWPLPKKRGAVGKRGPRALTSYTWTVDGVAPDEDENSLKGVSVILGFEKQADFTAALKAAGVNTTSPEDEFTVSISGKEVYAKRDTGEEEIEEDVTQPAETE
jgi:hypothetical protein